MGGEERETKWRMRESHKPTREQQGLLRCRTGRYIPPAPTQARSVGKRRVARTVLPPNRWAIIPFSSCAGVFLGLPVKLVGLPIAVLGHFRMHISRRGTPAKKRPKTAGNVKSRGGRRALVRVVAWSLQSEPSPWGGERGARNGAWCECACAIKEMKDDRTWLNRMYCVSPSWISRRRSAARCDWFWSYRDCVWSGLCRAPRFVSVAFA